jgi:hypothetical protein
MPRPLSKEERQAFLAEPHIAVLSVAGDDGRPPLSAPTWYDYCAYLQEVTRIQKGAAAVVR